ncbi:MAG: hypothetical protein RSC93_02150 [Erysipelotrichaceae bacterium]
MTIEYKFLINPNKETLLNCYNAENTMFPYFSIQESFDDCLPIINKFDLYVNNCIGEFDSPAEMIADIKESIVENFEHAEFFDYSIQWHEHNSDNLILLVNPNVSFLENIMKRVNPSFVATYATLKSTHEQIGLFLDSKGLKGNYWYGFEHEFVIKKIHNQFSDYDKDLYMLMDYTYEWKPNSTKGTVLIS